MQEQHGKLKKILQDKGLYDKLLEQNGKDYVPNYNDLVKQYGRKTESVVDSWIEHKAGRIAYNGTVDLHFEYAKWNKATAIRATNDDSRAISFAKTGIGQFAHYRFNMMNLMFKWMKEAGISYKSLDFTSEEALKPLRLGLLQATIGFATITANTNFMKLFDNDVARTGEQMYWWLASNREKWRDGEISPETAEKLDAVTYGQRGMAFLGPNVQYKDMFLNYWELYQHIESQRGDFELSRVFDEAVKQAAGKDDNQRLYNILAPFNAQMARTVAYTSSVFNERGLPDAARLELGLFPSKEQREWRNWGREQLGWRDKPKKKMNFNKRDFQSKEMKPLLESLDLIGKE